MKIFSDDEDGEEQEPMSVADFARVKNNKEKLHREDMCPTCGSTNTEKHEYYWRCLDDCDTITYFPSSYTITLGDLI